MSYDDLYKTTNYLRGSEVIDRTDSGKIAARITGSEVKTFDDNRQKVLLHLVTEEGEEALILNKTNYKAITNIFGKNPAEWVGKAIILTAYHGKFKGQPFIGIRVDNHPENAQQKEMDLPTAPPVNANNNDDDLPF